MGHADGDLEGEQVALAGSALVDFDVDGGAAGFLVVEGVVLDVAHDLVGLDAAGELADHGSGENGIFAGVFEVAAVAGIAGEVDAAADGHVVAHVAELAADDGAEEEEGILIPAARGAEHGGQQRGVVTALRGEANADGGVGHG